MKKKVWYLSGAISSDEHYREKFTNAEHVLRSLGFAVCNPVDTKAKGDKDWAYYMKKDIQKLLKCDGIMLLPDWLESRGAKLEYVIAEELGLMVLDYDKVIQVCLNE